jgi:predicted  nucleic acid-binding Zn-ribbon protein
MSDTTGTESAAPEADASPASTDAVAEAPAQPEDSFDWKAETEKVRREAAKHRTEKNTLKTELESVTARITEADKLQETYETGLVEAAQSTEKYERLRSAIAGGIPLNEILDMADRLKGETPEEWEADAKQLASKLTAKTVKSGDPSQGVPSKTTSHSPFGDYVRQTQGR